jgi:uncharacterized membrane protein
MLANSFFELLGKFFENILFIPYDLFRNGISGWWTSNMVNWIFVIIAFIAFFYWMGQMNQFKKQGKEDEA